MAATNDHITTPTHGRPSSKCADTVRRSQHGVWLSLMAGARAAHRNQVWRDVDALCHQQFNAMSLVGRLSLVNSFNRSLPRHHERVGALVHEARAHAATLRNIKAHRDECPNNDLLPT